MKIRIFTIAFAFAILQSCDDEKDSSVSIKGTWAVQTQEQLECPNSADNKVLTCGTYAFCTTITFAADETFQLKRTSDGSSLGNGTYHFAAGHLYVTFTNNPGGFANLDNASATISGNTLITTVGGTFMGSPDCKTKTTYHKL